MTDRKARLPRWVWPAVAGAVGGAVFLWSLTLRDSDGNKIIDSTAVAFATVIASVLIVILQRTHAVEHEVKPNSGSSMKDSTNRTEAMVQTVVFDIAELRRTLGTVQADVGGLREENRDDRREAADDRRNTAEQIAELRGRVHGLEISKGAP